MSSIYRCASSLSLEAYVSKDYKYHFVPHLRFHDLRQTFATRLVRAGVDLVAVQHLMGHSTIAMTTRYAHSLADDKMAAVRRLDFAGVR